MNSQMRVTIALLFGLFVLVPFASAETNLYDTLLEYWGMNGSSSPLTGHRGNSSLTEGRPPGGYDVTGKIDDSVYFDADANFNTTDTLALGTQYTVSMWVMANTTQPESYPLLMSPDVNKKLAPYVWGNAVSANFHLNTGDGVNWDGECYSSTNIRDDTWHHVVFSVDGTGNRRQIWIDGNIEGNCSGAVAWSASTAEYFIGSRYDDAFDFKGRLDEIGIWNRVLTQQEVTYLYNGDQGQPYWNFSSGPTITVTLDSPTNGTHLTEGDSVGNQVVIVFNITNDPGAGVADCDLYVNDTWQDSLGTYANESVNAFRISPGYRTITDGWQDQQTHRWNIQCNSTSGARVNSSVSWEYTTDRINPIINTESNNWYAAANTTSIDRRGYADTVQWNISYNDTWLWGYNVTVRRNSHSGPIIYSEQETNLTAENASYENTTNITAWPLTEGGETLYINFSVEDDHTAHQIPDYDYVTTPQSIIYQTEHGRTITIEAVEGNLNQIITQKEVDRYTFALTWQSARKEHQIDLSCDDTLYYRGDLYEWPTFVCGGNWIDFVPKGMTIADFESVNVVKKTSGKYNLNFKTFSDVQTLDFHSLGGLNRQDFLSTMTMTETYVAENLSVNAYNLSWIDLSWQRAPNTPYSILIRNGTVIYNGTATTYNDSGLPRTGINYQYTVKGHNGTDETDNGDTLTQPTWRPSVIYNLTSTPDVGHIELFWNWSHGAQGAFIYRDSTLIYNFTNTSEHFYNDTGLAPATSYTYTIYSWATNGSEEFNNTAVQTGNNTLTVSTIYNGTLSVEIRNEVTNQRITGVFFQVNLIGTASNLTGNTTNGLIDITNITSDNYTLRHTGDGWGLRDQYLEIFSNQTANVVLYLLNDTVREPGLITVVDTTGSFVDGAIIKRTRYHANENAYNVVEMARSNQDGRAIMTGQVVDAYYKWVVEWNGTTVILTTEPENLLLAGTEWYKTFRININNDFYESYLAAVGATTSLTFNNATRYASYTWNDPTGTTTQGCVTAEYARAATWHTIGPNCSSGATGSIILYLPQSNESVHKVSGYLDTNTQYSTPYTNTLWTAPAKQYNYGFLGGFLGFGILVGTAALFSFSATLMLIATVIVTIILSFNPILQLFPFGFGALISIGALAVGFSIYMMRR